MLNWSDLDKLYRPHEVVPIAYKGIKSLLEPYEIFTYHCITRKLKKSVNPYFIGTFRPDLSSCRVNCYERDYHLKDRQWWNQNRPPEGTSARKQWMDWVWRNDLERMRFNAWLDEKFGGDVVVVEKEQEPVQLALF